MRSDSKIKIDVMWTRKEYTSDLTDAEWAIIEPLSPEDKAVGRLREVDLREVLNAINDRADHGAKWRNLPGEFPAWQTVYSYFRSGVRVSGGSDVAFIWREAKNGDGNFFIKLRLATEVSPF